jgi:hypothetical protein
MVVCRHHFFDKFDGEEKTVLIRKQRETRVARWFLFEPKILLWENFGGPYVPR